MLLTGTSSSLILLSGSGVPAALKAGFEMIEVLEVLAMLVMLDVAAKTFPSDWLQIGAFRSMSRAQPIMA